MKNFLIGFSFIFCSFAHSALAASDENKLAKVTLDLEALSSKRVFLAADLESPHAMGLL